MSTEVHASRYREWVIIGVLALLALTTRVFGIWEWSLIGDEYFTVAFAKERAASFVNPAYYMLVLVSTELFGLTEWSARLPSVILGTLSVPIFYVLCRSVLDRRTAIIGALLIIFSGWHLYHSQLSRFYSGVFLFGMISYFIFVRALQKDSYWLLGGVLLSNIVGVLFHATSILVPASCAGYALVILLWSSASTSYSRRIARAYILIVSVAALITLPFFLSIAHTWSVMGKTSDTVGVLLDLLEGVNIVLVIGAIFGLLLLWRKDPPRGLFFAVGIGVPVGMLVLGSLILPNIRAKYVFYILPLFIALAAFLCAQVASVCSQYQVSKFAVVGILITSLLPGFVSHYSGRMSLDVRDPVQFIENKYQHGDTIVVFSPAIKYNFGEEFPDEAWKVVGAKAVWRGALEPLEGASQQAWVLVDTYRGPRMRRDLEAWLMEHASLVWRKDERRFDYSMKGYEVWLVDGPSG